MKLFTSVGPNPRVVMMFMAEKNIEIERVPVDILQGENRRADHLRRNPLGQTPTLQMDDGGYLSEVLPICEYLEELHPRPALIGETPEERAEVRMWSRRIDLNICETISTGYRNSEGLPLFKDRILTAPEIAPGMKRMAANRLQWLDGQIGGRPFVCGARFTLADILLFCFVEFAENFGQPLDRDLTALRTWFDRVGRRPSALASRLDRPTRPPVKSPAEN